MTMTNLLAILVSLAMMLTGATAPVAEPVSRTLQVSNIIVRHNDEEVALTPCASLGVTTDGEKAAFDFCIENGGDTLLPFQVLADADGLLVLNDNSDTTLKIDAETIEGMLDGQMGEDGEAVLAAVADYINAYAKLFRLMKDADAMAAIQQKGDALLDEMLDRGTGVEGKLEYDDETYAVMTYEYDLDSAQLGALADALYASDDTLAEYARAYFALLSAMPGDSGLSGLTSYEEILAKSGVAINMHVVESIAEEGLDISDSLLTLSGEGLEKPVEFSIHTVKDDDGKASEITGLIDIEGTTVDMYMEAAQSGADIQMGMSMAINPADEVEANEVDEDVEVIIEEADDEDEEPYEEDEEEEEVVDGESDSEDAIFVTMDFNSDYDDEEMVTNQSLGYTVDVADSGIHMEYGIDGSLTDAGEGEYQMAGEANFGEETYGFELTATIGNAPIEVRADAGKAVVLDGFDPTALMSGVSADAMKLYSDESVQKLVAMAQSAMEAAANVEPVEIVEDAVEDAVEEAGGEGVASGGLPFGNPQFNWLPDGYRVDVVNVDEEYQDVNCTLVNDETNETIYVDIASSYSLDGLNHYVLNDDGTCTPIEGKILNEEVSGGYSVYNIDNGTFSISVFPNGNTTTEEVAHLLSELTF